MEGVTFRQYSQFNGTIKLVISSNGALMNLPAQGAKIRTILFGASKSLFYFVNSTKQSRQFLACADNDRNLWGTKIDNISIISPKHIVEFEFDQIVILTQWCKEVTHQLVSSIGVEQSKILVPDRRLLGPAMFDDLALQAAGIELIQILMGKAMDSSIPLVVDMGTLLGIVRNKSLIPWDSDIDFAVPLNFMQEIEKIIFEIEKSLNGDFSIDPPRRMLKDDQIVQLEFLCHVGNVERKSFPVTVNARNSINNESIWLAFPGLWSAPSHYFEEIETVFFQGKGIQIPGDVNNYLAFMYGADWQTPKPNFTYDDYPNN